MFKMTYWDREFSTTHMSKSNPLADKVMVNGLIVDIQSLPPDIQNIVYEKRGYVPVRREPNEK